MARHQTYGVHQRGRRLVVAVVLALIAAFAPAVVAPTVAAAAGTDVALTRFGSLAVDPVSGRVFVAGDDKVVVFDPAGAPIGTINSVYGAQAMSFDGGYLWVTQTTAGSIAKIDPSTLTKVDELPTGAPVGRGIATVGGLIWFTSPTSSSYVDLKTLDPATGIVTTRYTQSIGTDLVEIPGSDTHLLHWSNRGGSPYFVHRLDLRTNPVTIEANVDHGVGSNLAQVAVTEDGTFVTAAGSPYRFNEFSLDPTQGAMKETGVVYPGTNYPRGIASTPARGGLIAGTTSSSKYLFVYRPGIPVPAFQIALTADPVQAGLALASDGSRAYVLTDDARLHTYALTPTVTSMSTTSITANRDQRVTVSGTGLGSMNSVTLGGVPVPFAHDGANALVLDIRTTLNAGLHTLVVSGPLGSASRSLGVTANGSTTVTGTITRGGEPVSGASISLRGESGSPNTTTTGATGTYAFTGIPSGSHYDLSVTSDSVTVPLRDLDIVGPASATFDIDLLAAPPSHLRMRTIQLPPGAVRRLVVDQATGRYFVAVGDQIVVFDRNGRRVGRIAEQWSVSDLQIVGTTLYAMLQRAGVISVIDVPSLTVTRTVPLARTTTGTMAVVGNRAHYADGDNQWTRLVSLDLTTGAISEPGTTSLYVPAFVPVDGDVNGFLSWAGSSSSKVIRWVAEPAPPTPAATTPQGLLNLGVRDFVASGVDDRVWSADGDELYLSTMAPTGVVYPRTPGSDFSTAAAHSPGHGGVLLFGDSIVRQGTPSLTHVTEAAPAPRSAGIDAAGDRVAAATVDGNLVISDLAPVVNAITPNPAAEPVTNVVVSGAGLGGTTSVTIDGASVPFTRDGSDQLTVSPPSLTVGEHVLTVETPWGTSVPRRLVVSDSSPATVSSMTPATGPATGGSTVTLTGTGFQVATSVSFGGRVADDLVVLSDTKIMVTVPAHPAGNADVAVTKSGVDSVGGPSYRYIDPRTTGPIPALAEVQGLGGNYRPFAGDFNGDGVEDLFMYQPGSAPDHIRLYRGDGLFTTRAVNVTGDYQPLAGDFNGDGTTDVLWYAPGTAADYQWDFATDGSYVSTRRTATGRYQPFTGDFNGDSYDDIFWYAPGTAPDYQWNYGPGDTYQSLNRTATGRYQPFTGDFNGNGYDDIFWYAPGTAADYLWSYGTGGTYQSKPVNASMTSIPVVADLTGGGIDDIFWYGPGAAPDVTWFMSPIVR